MAYLWALMIVVVMAALLAATAPYLAQINDNDRVNDAFTQLRAVGVGINNFSTTINNFPGKPSQLTNKISVGDKTSCWTAATAFAAADTTSWNSGAPFVAFTIPVGGLWTPIGRLRDSIPQRATTGASLFLQLVGVSRSDAARFKALVDSNATPAGDTITVSAGAANADTVTITMRVFKTPPRNVC